MQQRSLFNGRRAGSQGSNLNGLADLPQHSPRPVSGSKRNTPGLKLPCTPPLLIGVAIVLIVVLAISGLRGGSSAGHNHRPHRHRNRYSPANALPGLRADARSLAETNGPPSSAAKGGSFSGFEGAGAGMEPAAVGSGGAGSASAALGKLAAAARASAGAASDLLASVADRGSRFKSEFVSSLDQDYEDDAAVLGTVQASPQTLRFKVCNGFANQRLAVVYGMLVAAKTGRSPVVPVLIGEGTQNTTQEVLADMQNEWPFSDVYDQSFFVRRIARTLRLRVLEEHEAPTPRIYTKVRLQDLGYNVMEALRGNYKAVDHLALDCPLFRVLPWEVHQDDEAIVWAVLDALKPAPSVLRMLDETLARVAGSTAAKDAAVEAAAVAAAALDSLMQQEQGQDLVQTQAAEAVTKEGSPHPQAQAAAVQQGAPVSGGGAAADVTAAVGSSGSGGDSKADAAAAAKKRRSLLADGVALGLGAAAAVGGSLASSLHLPRLQGSSSGGALPGFKFNFVHLRMEDDWIEHCKRWSSIKDGIVRDNCYNHTEEVDVQLKLFAFPTSQPLYVATYWPSVAPERAKAVLERLRAAGYHLVTSHEAFPDSAHMHREQRALVEYFLGLAAHRFLGNSVSSFAALALVERRHLGRWAAYYNGGDIPMAQILPVVHKLPWVFTYNSWSGNYDYMLKAAVRSARSVGTLKPYCIFDGNSSSPVYRWLVAQGVTMIRHAPAWRPELLKLARAKMAANVQHSHLYKSDDMLVSTFQRVDLPLVPILDQYTYVLYTDADVYFRRPLHLVDFGLPLTPSITMSYEFQNMFPYNAGIFLANLPTMRRNYRAFLRMMLDPKNSDGLYYMNFGPADQGALNKYYERDLRARMMNQQMNTKPYNPFDPNSFILHFHGPKPHEYVKFLESGKCDFYFVCEQAFVQALCQYAPEWALHLQDEPIAQRLADACSWIANPTIKEVFKKKWGLVPVQQAVPEDKKKDFVHADQLRPADQKAVATSTPKPLATVAPASPVDTAHKKQAAAAAAAISNQEASKDDEAKERKQ